MKKKWMMIVLVLCMTMGLLACGKQTNGETDALQTQAQMTWQEQYDLGIRLLNEGKYEDAILAFQAAIQIDPKNVDAYLGLADVYVQMGDVEKAQSVLQNALDKADNADAIQDKLDKLEQETAQETESARDETLEIETSQEQLENVTYPRKLRAKWTIDIQEDGSLYKNSFWEQYEYDDQGRLTKTIEMLNAGDGDQVNSENQYIYFEGVCVGHSIYNRGFGEGFVKYYYDAKGRLIPYSHAPNCWQEEDNQGRCVRVVKADTGKSVFEFGYDEEGNYVKYIEFAGGSRLWSASYQYNDQGQLICEDRYGETDDIFTGRLVYEYNVDGTLAKKLQYDDLLYLVRTTVYEYDNNILVRESDFEESSGACSYYVEYIYSEHGELLKEDKYADYDDDGAYERRWYTEYVYQ